ncbi:hypothetical protein LSH36_279g03144 [Paralvinella palmiformis]|uniref:Beta-1,4-galactosyltransferase n=1 Tax=Paralvinella palmiformis TaxID=53620 RepID=A0AAD9JJ45_9ANNE|nr:hypothetical protein LSH36_279g03144 [Paralvinella palmiformis]
MSHFMDELMLTKVYFTDDLENLLDCRVINIVSLFYPIRNTSTADDEGMSVHIETYPYGQVHRATRRIRSTASLSGKSQTNLVKRLFGALFCRTGNNGERYASVKHSSVFQRIGLCLIGRYTRKVLALASLLIALYGYLTVMNTAIMTQSTYRMMRKPSRQDHYITYDGRELPLCPAYPKGLRGLVYVNQTKPTWAYLREQNTDIQMGGYWKPSDCIARHRVAIVIPYRNRETNLLLWLQHMHPFLKKQKIEYTIYVAEQAAGKTFNRGLDRNIAFVEAEKLGDHDCTIFHDVDLLPIDDRNLYSCPDHPRHMCVATHYIFNYMPLYNNSYAMFGGVTSFRNDQFRSVNGYSNIYFGWGAEDDDLHNRLVARGMPPYRYPDKIGRYYGSPHTDDAFNPVFLANEADRFKMLRVSAHRINVDGLNTMRYTVKSISKRRLFTRIYYDIEQDFYANEAKKAVDLYHEMYGDLSPFWKQLRNTPVPYAWKKNKKN